MTRWQLSRRNVLRGCVAASLCLAIGTPEAPVLRRARFRDGPRFVTMTVSVAELLRTSDVAAMESLDSGFATKLALRIALFRDGRRSPLNVIDRRVRIFFDPWNDLYVVETTDGKARAIKRTFRTRTKAVKAATSLRVRVAGSDELVRGKGNATYYVRVSGLRNPFEEDERAGTRARPRSRELSAFSRWVSIFVEEQAKAEASLELRTSPNFYLEPK